VAATAGWGRPPPWEVAAAPWTVGDSGATAGSGTAGVAVGPCRRLVWSSRLLWGGGRRAVRAHDAARGARARRAPSAAALWLCVSSTRRSGEAGRTARITGDVGGTCAHGRTWHRAVRHSRTRGVTGTGQRQPRVRRGTFHIEHSGRTGYIEKQLMQQTTTKRPRREEKTEKKKNRRGGMVMATTQNQKTTPPSGPPASCLPVQSPW